MNRWDDYRRLAASAQKQAVNATDRETRKIWLSIADGWMTLVAEHERTQNLATVDAGASALETGQALGQ